MAGVTLTGSVHLFPWTMLHISGVGSSGIDGPFGRAQGLVFADGTYGAVVTIEDNQIPFDDPWYVRFYKLDEAMNVLGYTDERYDPSTVDYGAAQISTLLDGDFKVRCVGSTMAPISTRTCDIIDVDFSGNTPVILSHDFSSGGPAMSSYTTGVGSYYFPDDDLMVYTYWALGILVGSSWVTESYAPGGEVGGVGNYTTYHFAPTEAQPRRFLWATLDQYYPSGADGFFKQSGGEAIVSSSGTVTYNELFTEVLFPKNHDDTYWIRPIALEGNIITVFERVLDSDGSGDPIFPGNEWSWQVNDYNFVTGTRTLVSEVLEPALERQYLAENCDVQGDAQGNFMCFADKGPDYDAPYGPGTGNPGYWHEVLGYEAATRTLTSVRAPRPSADGHGEMDSLTARSTGGAYGFGRWAMAFTGVDLFETNDFYASDFWCGTFGAVAPLHIWVPEFEEDDPWPRIGNEGRQEPGRLNVWTGTGWAKEYRVSDGPGLTLRWLKMWNGEEWKKVARMIHPD